MNLEKENSMNKGDHSDSSSKAKPQQVKESDRKQPDSKADATQRSSGMGQFDKQNQPEDRSRKDMDSERRPEEPATDSKEFTKKDNKNYNETSDRV